jgi:hypothetical protein
MRVFGVEFRIPTVVGRSFGGPNTAAPWLGETVRDLVLGSGIVRR